MPQKLYLFFFLSYSSKESNYKYFNDNLIIKLQRFNLISKKALNLIA